MPIPVRCACGKTLSVAEALGGKTMKCPACGADLAVPEAGGPAAPPPFYPPPPPPPKHGPMFVCGIVIAVLAGGFVVVALLMAILLPAIARAIFHARQTKCSAQVSQLVKACHNYSVTKSPIEGRFPEDVSGGEWILRLKTSGEISDDRMFHCPAAGPAAGGTNYRGYNQRCAAGTVNKAPDDAVIIADRDSNHGLEEDVMMNYALKRGSVQRARRNSDVWRRTVPATVIE